MSDDKIRFRCPGCDKAVSVAAIHAGKRAKCPGCGNLLVVPQPEPVLEPEEVEDFEALLERCMEELRIKTEAHDSMWQLGTADWALDQETGLITFTGGKMVATAPAQIIGTFSTTSDSWLWGWDNPSVTDNMAEHAHRVYEYGEEHGIELLTTRKLECDENLAWGLTALACHLCESQGAYRGPAGPALVFMTFGEVTLTKGKRR